MKMPAELYSNRTSELGQAASTVSDQKTDVLHAVLLCGLLEAAARAAAR